MIATLRIAWLRFEVKFYIVEVERCLLCPRLPIGWGKRGSWWFVSGSAAFKPPIRCIPDGRAQRFPSVRYFTMRGLNQMALSFSDEPLALTAKTNSTDLPAREARSMFSSRGGLA